MSKSVRPSLFTRPFDLGLLQSVAVGIMLRHWYATGLYWYNHRKLPRIAVPKTFNDKIFWRKIVDRNPMFVTFNDKVKVRDWVKDVMPELPQTEMLWHGPDPKSIPDDALHARAMFKANHGCGWNKIYDPQTMSREDVVTMLEQWLQETFGGKLSEWAYAQIPPQGLIEEMLSYPDGAPPDNLNVHSSDGKVLFVGLYKGSKQTRREIGFFDGEARRLPISVGQTAPLREDYQPSPALLKALETAKVLSKGFDYVRCDFMGTDQDIWYNEITTYTGSGHLKFSDPELIGEIQQDWDLRKSWFLSTPQGGFKEIYRKALLRELTRRVAQ
ncbi:ATP-grasp fold amidoligase family protein [Shimia sediminis]|uniref:ATP-grasp fold amidoligase family protein n=1 Tax=Shimia sediminis TaxID=2497945 RepID=UPI000F8C3A38|nr:ATP-grasp fold amidoligase family protein [Shimia sediminis]